MKKCIFHHFKRAFFEANKTTFLEVQIPTLRSDVILIVLTYKGIQRNTTFLFHLLFPLSSSEQIYIILTSQQKNRYSKIKLKIAQINLKKKNRTSCTASSYAIFVCHILLFAFFFRFLQQFFELTWTAFQSKLRPNSMRLYFTKKTRRTRQMTLNKDSTSYDLKFASPIFDQCSFYVETYLKCHPSTGVYQTFSQ